MSSKIGFPVVSVKLNEEGTHGASEDGLALSLPSDSPFFHCQNGQEGAYLILIRPDGHIAGIANDLVSREALV